MSPDQLAALGAFLSGMGSVIGGFWVIRNVRRRAEKDCQQRLAELHDSLVEGVRLGADLEGPK